MPAAALALAVHDNGIHLALQQDLPAHSNPLQQLATGVAAAHQHLQAAARDILAAAGAGGNAAAGLAAIAVPQAAAVAAVHACVGNATSSQDAVKADDGAIALEEGTLSEAGA